MEEDPSVFAYDEVYDDMKEKAARPKMQDKVVREVILRPVHWLLSICASSASVCPYWDALQSVNYIILVKYLFLVQG